MMAKTIAEDLDHAEAQTVNAEPQKQTPPKRSHSKSASWETTLRAGLTDFYTSAAMGITLLESRNPQTAPWALGDGVIVTQRSDALVAAWIELARGNMKLREILLRFVKGSALTTLIAGHVALLVEIRKYHSGPPIDPASMKNPYETSSGDPHEPFVYRD